MTLDEFRDKTKDMPGHLSLASTDMYGDPIELEEIRLVANKENEEPSLSSPYLLLTRWV